MATNAIVTVELEIRIPSTWSDDTTMNQIKKQAKEDTRNIINKAFSDKPNIKARGEMEVKAVTHDID